MAHRRTDHGQEFVYVVMAALGAAIQPLLRNGEYYSCRRIRSAFWLLRSRQVWPHEFPVRDGVLRDGVAQFVVCGTDLWEISRYFPAVVEQNEPADQQYSAHQGIRGMEAAMNDDKHGAECNRDCGQQ